jgi:hypothetical protein
MKRLLLAVAIGLSSLPALAEDPNCKVSVRSGSAIRNAYTSATSRNESDAKSAIGNLDFADLYRRPPFRINRSSVRLDAQGLSGGGDANWQVQINGISGSSTIAHVQVEAELGGASTRERQQYVQRKVRGALLESLRTGKSYRVTGSCD